MLSCILCRGTNLLHWFHFRYVKLQHILNSTLQCNYRTWTTGAGTLQLQFNNAVFKAPVQNITSILLHCWSGYNTASERQSNRDTTHLHILTLFECPEALLSLQPLHHHHLKVLKNEKIFIFINKNISPIKTFAWKCLPVSSLWWLPSLTTGSPDVKKSIIAAKTSGFITFHSIFASDLIKNKNV